MAPRRQPYSLAAVSRREDTFSEGLRNDEKRKNEQGLTKPEETEGSYQDHLFLILCENLATSAMMGDGTREDNESVCSFAPRGEGEKTQGQRSA
jgi:hypothetical protein